MQLAGPDFDLVQLSEPTQSNQYILTLMRLLLDYIGIALSFVQFSHTWPIITSETSSGCTFERISAPVMAADPNSWAFMDDILPFRVPKNYNFMLTSKLHFHS